MANVNFLASWIVEWIPPELIEGLKHFRAKVWADQSVHHIFWGKVRMIPFFYIVISLVTLHLAVCLEVQEFWEVTLCPQDPMNVALILGDNIWILLSSVLPKSADCFPWYLLDRLILLFGVNETQRAQSVAPHRDDVTHLNHSPCGTHFVHRKGWVVVLFTQPVLATSPPFKVLPTIATSPFSLSTMYVVPSPLEETDVIVHVEEQALNLCNEGRLDSVFWADEWKHHVQHFFVLPL